MSAGLRPAEIFVIRFALAYIGIWGVCLYRGRRPEGKVNKRVFSDRLSDELIFLFLGITGGSFYFLTENSALVYTQACNVAFLVCSAPLFTAILTIVMKRTMHGKISEGLEDIKVGLDLVVGTLLALGGMALVVFERQSLQLSPKGDLYAIGAALCWALYSVFMAQMTTEYGALFATRKVFFYGIAGIIPYFLIQGQPTAGPSILANPVVWGNLLYLGLVASMLCFVLWNLSVGILGTVRTTNMLYSQPFFTMLVAAIVLSEKITWMALAGAVLIVLGMVLFERNRK